MYLCCQCSSDAHIGGSWREESIQNYQASWNSRSYRGKFSCWNLTSHWNNSTVDIGKQIVIAEFEDIDVKVDRRFCLVVPTCLKKTFLNFCHDTKSAGHLGQQKTYNRAKQSFHWHHLSQDCTEYVKECTTCYQNKKPHIKPRAALKSYHARFPMERVQLHILSPFNTSESGNNYILMMIDQFSKLIEMADLPDQTALLLTSFLSTLSSLLGARWKCILTKVTILKVQCHE